MLTPIDIENKEFAKSFRGYDIIEVDEFMRSLVIDYESLYRENASLKEKHSVLLETLENYKGMESTMQNAILVAQKTAEDIKQHAYERSNTITHEAEVKAGNIISTAEKRAQELEKEYSALKKEMNTFKARMSSLLHTYLRLIEETQQKEKSEENKKENPADLSVEQKISQPEKEKNDKEKNPAELKSDNIPKESKPSEDASEKKINPLVDELLKQRDSQKNKNTQNGESFIKTKEMIIDLPNDKSKKYDVFNDEAF